MLPASPVPWMNSMLLIACGMRLGIKLWESRIEALKILCGEMGEVYSSLKMATPMTDDNAFNFQALKLCFTPKLWWKSRSIGLFIGAVMVGIGANVWIHASVKHGRESNIMQFLVLSENRVLDTILLCLQTFKYMYLRQKAGFILRDKGRP